MNGMNILGRWKIPLFMRVLCRSCEQCRNWPLCPLSAVAGDMTGEPSRGSGRSIPGYPIGAPCPVPCNTKLLSNNWRRRIIAAHLCIALLQKSVLIQYLYWILFTHSLYIQFKCDVHVIVFWNIPVQVPMQCDLIDWLAQLFFRFSCENAWHFENVHVSFLKLSSDFDCSRRNQKWLH